MDKERRAEIEDLMNRESLWGYYKVAVSDLLAALVECEKERDAARWHLSEIARVSDTLSPQELINHAASGCGIGTHDYEGAAHPHRSIVELTSALKTLRAELEDAEARAADATIKCEKLHDEFETCVLMLDIRHAALDDNIKAMKSRVQTVTAALSGPLAREVK
jgi:hypothetical protein